MFVRKYNLLIVIAFLGIFFAKMVISGAPVFFAQMDKDTMKSVIMQLEMEQESDGDTSKVTLKYVDSKFNFHFDPLAVPMLFHFKINNDFIDHNKRYIDPYHPTVPTPPPNHFI